MATSPDPAPERKRKPLVEEIATQLAEIIRTQQLPSGHQLPNEFQLAEQLGVGRGTIREAVKSLVSRNVLEIRHGKGTFVAQHPGMISDPFGLQFYPDQLRLAHDLLELRLVMEPHFAALAAQRATQEQLVQLKVLAAEIEKQVAYGEDCSEIDAQFHQCIAECTQNVVMPCLLSIVGMGAESLRRLHLDRHWDASLERHRALVKAIGEHAPDEARAAMEAHLGDLQQTVQKLAQQLQPDDAAPGPSLCWQASEHGQETPAADGQKTPLGCSAAGR